MPNQINLRTTEQQHQFWTSFATARSLPLATLIKRIMDKESGYRKPATKPTTPNRRP